MSTKLPNHYCNIGDVDVYYSENHVQITVDGNTKLFIPRDEEFGINELSEALKMLTTGGDNE